MTFSLDDHWVWDFWLADDGDRYHLFYLHAPKSLGDQNLRHRNARIGHAVSSDLENWTDRGVVLQPGAAGDFDETATWTGSVVRGADGLWRMFYTGSWFLAETSVANVESVGVAVSRDLHHWTKSPGPVTRADPRWYETLGSSGWREEAWRDPWVFEDPHGAGWHMLVTARANSGDLDDRGVIGHATSADLENWRVEPPLSEPGSGFAHLEVPQVAQLDERWLMLFSCDTGALASTRLTAGERGGIWALEAPSALGPFAIDAARLIAPESLYSGRIIQNRTGEWVLLAFENAASDGGFVGAIGSPLPISWSAHDSTIRLHSQAGIS